MVPQNPKLQTHADLVGRILDDVVYATKLTCEKSRMGLSRSA